MNRRSLLLQLLGLGAAGIGAATVPALAGSPRRNTAAAAGPLPFKPIRGPIPLPTDGLSAAQQRQHYARINLDDRVVVPEGYRSELLLSWGDRLAQGRFGFNNDYLAFTPLNPDTALLTVNFEYISPRLWCEGYAEVMGTELPFAALRRRWPAVAAAWMCTPWRPRIPCGPWCWRWPPPPWTTSASAWRPWCAMRAASGATRAARWSGASPA